MLIVLSLLLFGVAYKISKDRMNKVGKMFIALLGMVALVSGIGGTKVLSDAYAVTFTSTPVSLPKNTNQVLPRVSLTEYKNDIIGQTVVIDKILSTPSLACNGFASGGIPACQVGMQLPVNTSCAILCSVVAAAKGF